MQRELTALGLWYEWSAAVAQSKGDVAAVLPAIAVPRITSKKVPGRVVCTLKHVEGRLTLELRATFAGVPGADVEFHGSHRESAVIATGTTAESGEVYFRGNHVTVRWAHEGVTKVLGAVFLRTRFIPARLAPLVDAANVTSLAIAVDSKYGLGYAIAYSPRYGVDVASIYAKMGLSLTRGDGTPFTELDVEMHEATKGPNAPWPSDVYWRDAHGHETKGTTMWFGGNGARVVLKGM